MGELNGLCDNSPITYPLLGPLNQQIRLSTWNYTLTFLFSFFLHTNEFRGSALYRPVKLIFVPQQAGVVGNEGQESLVALLPSTVQKGAGKQRTFILEVGIQSKH